MSSYEARRVIAEYLMLTWEDRIGDENVQQKEEMREGENTYSHLIENLIYQISETCREKEASLRSK